MEPSQEIPFVDIHTHRMDTPYPSLYSVRLGREAVLPCRPFSAGVHPWDAASAPSDALDGIESKFLYAIGETGLDFAVEDSSGPVADRIGLAPPDGLENNPDLLKTDGRSKQYEWFRRQLRLAEEFKLPVVIHCVKAYNEVLTELRNFTRPVIFHGFTGSPELAGQVWKRGYYLSFGANIFRSPKTIEALESIPAGQLFMETDDSGLDIEEIYSQAAVIRSCAVSELKSEIYENYLKIFPREIPLCERRGI